MWRGKYNVLRWIYETAFCVHKVGQGFRFSIKKVIALIFIGLVLWEFYRPFAGSDLRFIGLLIMASLSLIVYTWGRIKGAP